MKAMLLAAGRGTRMGALTAARPKPLLEVGGEPLIVRHVARLAAAGITGIVVNLAYRGAQIRDVLGDGRAFGIAIEYSDEGDAALETAGGIVRALPLLGPDPFVVVNADIFTDFDFATLTDANGPCELVLVPNPAHSARGDFVLGADGRLGGRGQRLTFAGISLLDPALFAGLAPGRRPLKPVLDAAIGQGMARGRLHAGLWLDVGTPERLDTARRAAAAAGHAAGVGS